MRHAGHSVDVLLKIYAKRVDDQEKEMNDRILKGLGAPEQSGLWSFPAHAYWTSLEAKAMKCSKISLASSPFPRNCGLLEAL